MNLRALLGSVQCHKAPPGFQAVKDWTEWSRRIFLILMALALLPSTALKKVAAALPGEQWQVLNRLAHANLSISLRGSQAGDAVDAATTDVRALRLYHVHTGESLTITYKRDGRYIPSAMAQLDYFLRDWRTNGFVSMSGETIDLMWELHEELGSKQPIDIICGFRSARTNALLKHIGRHVANRSEHILGRAIDIQFPDVPVERLRNSALVRQAGGVGYYPARSGGFVHIDSGQVRHWPWISKTELAKIFAAHSGSSAMRDERAAASSPLAAAEQDISSPPDKSADRPSTGLKSTRAMTNGTGTNVTRTNSKASTTNRSTTGRNRSESHHASTQAGGRSNSAGSMSATRNEGGRARASTTDRKMSGQLGTKSGGTNRSAGRGDSASDRTVNSRNSRNAGGKSAGASSQAANSGRGSNRGPRGR
jgi:uncharacterized protein YcbK (DUF882 family)